MKRYQGAVRWAPASSSQVATTPAEVERAEATRAAGFTSDVVVPLVQSLVTGALIGGLALVMLEELLPTFGGDPLKVWIGVTLGVAAASWLLLLRDTRRLLWGIERLIGLDLDRDQEVGKPSKRTLEVEVKDGRTTRLVDADWLGIDDDRLILFAAGIMRGRGLTEGEWGKDTAVFPRGINSFRAVRGKLLEAGLIAPVNPDAPNLSYRVTPAGRAVFRRLAECAHAHTHEGEA